MLSDKKGATCSDGIMRVREFHATNESRRMYRAQENRERDSLITHLRDRQANGVIKRTECSFVNFLKKLLLFASPNRRSEPQPK